MKISNNKELFTSKGLKNTKNRNQIYNILNQTDIPVTAEKIFLTIKETSSSINLSTVYRVLELFVDNELVLKSNLKEGNKAVFEVNRSEHRHYMVCKGCKQMFPVNGCPLGKYEEWLHDQTGFNFTGHKLELYGYCKSCQSS